MEGDLYSGKYTEDEISRILDINGRPTNLMRPNEAYYRKSGREQMPSWAEKREFVHWLINDSNISASSKTYLRDLEFWVPKYQMRGFQYGLFTSAACFAFMPVVRR